MEVGIRGEMLESSLSTVSMTSASFYVCFYLFKDESVIMLHQKEYYLYMAYVYVSESEVKRYRQDCSKVLKDVCTQLKNKNISAQFTLIGSGEGIWLLVMVMVHMIWIIIL